MLHQRYLPSVEDVHEGDGKHIRLLGSGQVRNVSVQGDTLVPG